MFVVVRCALVQSSTHSIILKRVAKDIGREFGFTARSGAAINVVAGGTV